MSDVSGQVDAGSVVTVSKSGDRGRKVWAALLGVVCLAEIAVGYSFLQYRSALWDWHRLPLVRAFGGQGDVSAASVPWVDLGASAAGATIAGWALALAWVAWIPLRRGEGWAAWCILTSLLAWFPVDTYTSVRLGAWENAALNAGALGLLLVPLFKAWPRGGARKAKLQSSHVPTVRDFPVA